MARTATAYDWANPWGCWVCHSQVISLKYSRVSALGCLPSSTFLNFPLCIESNPIYRLLSSYRGIPSRFCLPGLHSCRRATPSTSSSRTTKPGWRRTKRSLARSKSSLATLCKCSPWASLAKIKLILFFQLHWTRGGPPAVEPGSCACWTRQGCR